MDSETIQLVITAAESVGTIAILLLWLNSERKRNSDLSALIIQDWQRQRERELDKEDE